MKIRKITTKWLIEQDACIGGVKWFKGNFSDGLIITKKNIVLLVDKLLKRKKNTRFGRDDIVADSLDQLYYLLNRLTDTEIGLGYFFTLNDDDCTPKDIVNAFWKDYKKIK